MAATLKAPTVTSRPKAHPERLSGHPAPSQEGPFVKTGFVKQTNLPSK